MRSMEAHNEGQMAGTNSSVCRATSMWWLSLIAGLFCLSGCSYMNMMTARYTGTVANTFSPSKARDRNISPDKCSFVTGAIRADQQEKVTEIPTIIVAISDQNRKNEIVDSQLITWYEDSYYLYLPEGDYHLVMFADLDNNYLFTEDEMIGRYEERESLRINTGRISRGIISGIDIDVTFDDPRKWPEDIRLQVPQPDRTKYVKSLDDPIFDGEVAKMGVYDIPRFLEKADQILYFDEEWDPDRIPIVFVHGFSGTPRVWKPFVESLDREVFQPCFFYYPSGQSLEKTSEAFFRFFFRDDLETLHKVVFVAHSMGGLIVRSAMNKYKPHENNEFLYISYASPYGGNEAAQGAVENAPVLVPSWRDIASESDFIEDLFWQGLPRNITFYLFFAHRNDAMIKMGENTDGTISLKSQLASTAQKEAKKVHGYNENHVSILKSEKVIRRFQGILTWFARE